MEPVKVYATSLMGWKSEVFLKNMKLYGSAYHGGQGSINYFTLKGWSTIDIYQNKVETKLSIVQKNIQVDENIFDIKNYTN